MECGLSQLAQGCIAFAVAVTASWPASAQTPPDPATIVHSQEDQSAEIAVAWLGGIDARAGMGSLPGAAGPATGASAQTD